MPEQQKTTIFLDEDGEMSRPDEFQEWLSNMCALFADGKAVVSFERPKRTLRQNRFLWGWVYANVHQGLRDAGVTELHLMGPDGDLVTIPVTVGFIHLWLKMKHLSPKEPGEEPSTANLSTSEFTRYVEAIRHDETIRKYEIEIPDPSQPPIEAYETEQ